MSTRKRKSKNKKIALLVILILLVGGGLGFGTAALLSASSGGAGIFGIFGGSGDVTGGGTSEADSMETMDSIDLSETDDAPSTPEEIKKAAIEDRISSMSLEEKVCQMFLVSPEALTGVGQVIAAGETTRSALMENPVGGVIFFASNLQSRAQTEEMLGNYVKYSREAGAGIGTFLSVDEEGGQVARCAEKLGTRAFSPMYEYRDQGADVAYKNAFAIGSDIAGLGFNLDFAPDADVWSNPANTVIGRRAYSDDYNEAAQLVAFAVKGFNDAGVACTLKHFPGHGDTAEDSHHGAAMIKKSLDEVRSEEFLPFISGIEAGAGMVMMGHLTLPEADDMPASLSSLWIQKYLRGELGFDGVVITDALSMEAVSGLYSPDRLGVMAILAGNDLLLCTSDFKTMKSGVLSAVSSGEITEDRIDESLRRILSLKYDKGMM